MAVASIGAYQMVAAVESFVASAAVAMTTPDNVAMTTEMHNSILEQAIVTC